MLLEFLYWWSWRSTGTNKPRQAIFWSLTWCLVGCHLLMSKAPYFYVCYSLYLCHLCVIASGVLPSGDTPLLSLWLWDAWYHGRAIPLGHLVCSTWASSLSR
jgi:hypothetical protein